MSGPSIDPRLLDVLHQASSLELFQLSTLIERLLADPRRIIAVRKDMHLGQTVPFLDWRDGSLREGKLMAKLLGNRELMQAKVADVMDRGFPVVSEDVGMESAVKHLRTSPALLVEEYGRIVGIITRHDVLAAQ